MINKELKLILLVLEAHDLHNQNHVQRTAILADKLAQKLLLSDQQREKLKTGALLHDIGKLMLPHAILNKPGKLDQDEKEIVELVKYHHEWWNGSGYPEGLAGDDIPILAQVVAITSSFDIMTTERIYDSLLTPAEALAELKDYSGLQFSSELVKIFSELIKKIN
ncbi:HD domain-containing protein [Halanaerobium salsuginis]|uniref:HD domain-containing protein n=2 Tax=Halanaerobium salsuginis TaxID=29563 RepID=A0A1I4JP16_9FIRM|nr:HD domain-containing protein [Halanaerobium salsuginis]